MSRPTAAQAGILEHIAKLQSAGSDVPLGGWDLNGDRVERRCIQRGWLEMYRRPGAERTCIRLTPAGRTALEGVGTT